MSQGRGLDLKKGVRHLPGGDASLRGTYASHGVPMEDSTDGRSKKFAIAIAQCQRAKSVWRSNDPSIVIDVRGLGDENRPTLSKMYLNGTSFQQRPVSI